MSKHWTKEMPRADNVVTADSFNREYDQHKGVFNGGIDRRNLGKRTFGRAQIAANAFHGVKLVNQLDLPDAWQDSGGTLFNCVDYSGYAGGWQTLTTTTLEDAHEGVLHLEFSCWAWMRKYEDVTAPKFLAFQMLANGPVVVTGGSWRQAFCNPKIIADVPVPGGDVDIEIKWQFSAPKITVDTTGNAQMFFAGGQLLAIGRWR